MYISFGFLVLALTTALWGTHGIFEDVYRLEHAQIGADNIGIVLGQGDRKLLNRLADAQLRFVALEHAHHIQHACARNPSSAVACVPADRALEMQMAELRREIEAMLRLEWPLTLERAVAEAARLKIDPSIGRPLTAAVQRVFCAICAGVVKWRVKEFGYVVGVSSERAEVTLEEKKGWNYRLGDHEA